MIVSPKQKRGEFSLSAKRKSIKSNIEKGGKMGIGTSPGPESLKLACVELSIEIWKEASKQLPLTYPTMVEAISTYKDLYFKILDIVSGELLS